MQKPKRLKLDGVLLFDKPLGWTSNDAVQRIRRLFNAEKVGHTGTLDPLATGLLPLLFGEATKFSADLLEADKTYVAKVRLGSTTDTGDLEGQTVDFTPRQAWAPIDESVLQHVFAEFTGCLKQVPPMYSALKRDGRPLYEYAREGLSLERESRDIEILKLQLLSWHPDVTLDGQTETVAEFECLVTCSKGTYIRVLAEDIGKRLGCGAHLSGLRRIGVGRLELSESVWNHTQLTAATQQTDWDPAMVLGPVDGLLLSLPSVELDSGLAQRFSHGQRLPLGQRTEQGRVRVYRADGKVLLGTGLLNNDGAGNSLLSPERLIREHHDART